MFKILKKKIFIMALDHIIEQFKNKTFQWIKGDYFETQEKFDQIITENDIIYIIFKSGRRINIEILNEFVEIVDKNSAILNPILPNKPKNDPSYEYELDNNYIEPKTSTKINISEIKQNIGSLTESNKQEEIQKPIKATKVIEKDPITLLLEKQKENKIELNFSLLLN